jgi:hypothetical protein
MKIFAFLVLVAAVVTYAQTPASRKSKSPGCTWSSS